MVVVAADVWAPGSLHLLQPLDSTAHAWVATHLDWDMKNLVAGKVVSDAAIMLGLAGWLGVAAAALHTRHPGLVQALGTSAVVYWLAGGAIKHGDAPLVDALKHAFARERPSHYHNTYAFPSGHTTAATFICGTLLFLLLPLMLQALDEHQQQGLWQRHQQQAPSSARQAAAWLERHRWHLWAGAALLTATGRVLADVHWCSDTLAGACLGAALTAATVQLCVGLNGGGMSR